MKSNKLIKLISTLLAVLMLASVATIAVSATENEGPTYTTNTGKEPTYDYKTGTYKDADGNSKVIETAEEKLALMDYRSGTDKFELYVDAYSGEVAIRSKSTGEVLFTNPYNIGQSKATASSGNTKDEIMSQLVVHYTEVKSNMSGKLYSYTWAAERNQISVMNIKNGIRVEYTLGREESKSLLPRMIEASAFQEIVDTIEKNINAAIEAGTVADPANELYRLEKFTAWYTKFSLSETESQEMYDKYCEDYPILKKYADLAATNPEYENFTIYVLDETNIGEKDIKKQEGLIKEYHKEYTFKDLEEDHAFVEYKAETENYPVFRMALEYTVEDSGLVVRLPANGIRFNEALYRLDSIEILPYMGAGMNPNEGYTFFPDGSGTLFDFQKIAILGTRQQVSGKVYGQDYAYHEVSGQYEEIIRYPVFGVYEKEQLSKVVTDENGEEITVPYEKDRGYVAIVEEGDSLIEISSYHGGPTSEYNTIKLSVFPRPTDSYILADSISVGGSNEPITVVSARKYTGNYKVRYIMLTDDDVASAAKAAGKTAENYYEPSYVGMATAYRDYLYAQGALSRLNADKVGEDIPLYIEAFGALETTEKFLSIPIDVMTPLTTFQDIQTMYTNLKDSKITNVNFILKGFTKGGMTSPRVPYNLKWENAVSKEMDFEELTEYAKGEGFGLFPDFDFVFSSTDTLFDGLTLDKHAVKTIDDRYSSKREYSATKHTYVSYFDLALSPAYFSHFYEKFVPKYKKYEPIGISVSTLGSYLNSDFDEKEPYNRADGQKYTKLAFQYLDENLENTEIMTSGGNAYSWKYVDHITDIALDSSRFSIASASVPFLGIVLHGNVQIAGEPVNMEGNIDYAILKSIESGAALKFILSYRNTDRLKDYETLSQYYSVNYDIWYNDGKGDLITIYHELNEVLADVQTSIIVGHEYIEGTRVPDDDELLLDAEQEIAAAIEYETALKNANSESERKAIYDARQLIIKGNEILKNIANENAAGSLAAKIAALKAIYNGTDGEFDKLIADAEAALKAYIAVQQFHAIYSDYTTKPTHKVEDAIKAYEAYVKAPDNADNAKKWDDFKAILGADYTAALEAMLKAKADSEAAPTDAALKAAYDAAVKALDTTPAGVAVDIDKAIAAMEALESVKATFVASYNAATTDAEKTTLTTEYDAKAKEIYDELLKSGVVYEISYASKKIEGTGYYGGSRYYRDAAKYAYTQAIEKLNAKLDELYAAATDVMDEQERISEMYSLEKISAALKLLEDNEAFSDKERARLKGIVDALEAYLTDADTKAAFDLVTGFDVKAEMLKAFGDGDLTVVDGKYEKLYDATSKAKDKIATFDPVKDYSVEDMTGKLTGKAFAWTEKITVENENKVSIARPELNTQKYNSTDNMIVHETFDNGKEFLLNFNDYRVVVELDDTVYTLEAYGYVVIKEANT